MKRSALFVAAVIVVSAIAAQFLTTNREGGGGSAAARDGSLVEITAVPGAPMTIVHFWGTWCGPCREELPEFAAFRDEYAPKGVGFVVVADDPDFETVDRYLAGVGISVDPFLLDAHGTAARQWKIDAYPTTIVLSPTNQILAVYRGMVDWTSPLQKREILRLGGLEP